MKCKKKATEFFYQIAPSIQMRLALWCIENMASNNTIYMDGRHRNMFREQMQGLYGRKAGYSDSSIKRAVGELQILRLLKRVHRGCYKVNPEWFTYQGKRTTKNLIIYH